MFWGKFWRFVFSEKKDIATKYSLFKTFSTKKMLVPMSIGLYNIKQRNIKPIVNNIKNSKIEDLDFRTSIFGFQDLGFRTSTRGFRTWISGPGFQDLESSPSYGRLIFFPSLFSASTVTFLFTVTFLCVQWSQTDEEEESERRTGACILIHRKNRFCHRKCACCLVLPNPTVRAESRFPNPTVRAGSAGGLKHGTVVSRTDGRTHYVNLYI
jgi:hypothetical protein